MLKNLIFIVFIILVAASCKAKKMNQYKMIENSRERHGKWKEEYSSADGKFTSIGKYKKGEKVGVWKTTFQDKLYQKDRVRKSITKTKVFYPNGKLMEKGQSKVEVSDTERHWFYFGDWKYYDENGKLEYIKKYEDGKYFDSIFVKK